MSFIKTLLYVIGFPNGKLYVGRTVQTMLRRFRQHVRSLQPVGYAIRKYGPENCRTIVLVTGLTWEDAGEWEQFWIAELKTMAPAGYNLTCGGEGVMRLRQTPATRKKMSQTRHRKFQEDPIFREKVLISQAKNAASRRGRKYTGRRLEKAQIAMMKCREFMWTDPTCREKMLAIARANIATTHCSCHPLHAGVD